MAKNSVVVAITGDSKGLQNALGAAGDAFGTLTKAAGIAAAALGVAAAALGVKAVKSASELEQAIGGLQAVFKDQFGVMEDFANKAADSVGLAKSEYATLATVIGSQLKNMGVSTEQLAGQTDGLVRMGADLAAQFGGSTSEAVSALSSLLRGERDPIERYGVSINEAAVKAKMAEMGLEGLTGEAEKNAKLQATLALLTQQTADAQGAFSRESTTLAGGLQRLRANAENLSATFGTALLPAVSAGVSAVGALVSAVSNSPIFAAFTQSVTTASNQFADWVFGVLNGTRKLTDLKFDFSGIDFSKAIESFNGFRDSVIEQAPGIITSLINGLVSAASKLGTVAPKIVAALIDGITAAAPTIITAAVSIVDALVRGIVSGLPGLITAAVGLVKSLVDGITHAIPTLLTLIAEIIPQFIGALLVALPDLIMAAQDLVEALVIGLVQAIPVLMQGFTDMWAMVLPSIMEQYPAVVENGIALFLALVEALSTAIPQIVDAWTAAYPTILDAITAASPQILEAGKTAFLAIVQSVIQALPLIITAVVSMAPRITASIIQMMPAILAAGLQLFKALVQAIPVILPQLTRELSAMAPSMVAAVVSIGPALASAGGQIISGLVRGLQANGGRVVSALTSIAGGAVNAFKSFFGIKSPSRLMKGLGKFLPQGLAQGITGGLGVVKSAMGQLSEVAVGSFGSPSLSLSTPTGGAYGASSAAVTNNYEVHVHTLNATAETGAAIKESLRVYETAGGRQ